MKKYQYLFFIYFFNFSNPLINKDIIITSKKHPVVLIPGFAASQLYGWFNPQNINNFKCPNRSYYHQIWLRPLEIQPVHCFIQQISLIYNEKTNSMEDISESHIETAPFGDVQSVEQLIDSFPYFLTYYHHIVKKLVNIGYVRNNNIKGAPYDFRKLPLEPHLSNYFDKLTNMIENLEKNKKLPIVLISHSMGSCLTNLFLSKKSQEWKNKYIKSWISLNGVLGGSTKSMLLNTFGHFDLIPSFILSPKIIKQVFSSYPSTYYLQKSSKYFNLDKIIVKTPFENFTLQNISKLQSTILKDKFQDILKTNIPDIWVYKSPNVSFHCIYSSGLNTIDTIILDQNYNFDIKIQNFVSGDGTLTLEELKACNKLIKINTNFNSSIAEFENVEHVKLLKNKNLLNYLENYFNLINS